MQILNHNIRLMIRKINKPNIIGIQNNVNNKYVVFLDYDNKELSEVVSDLKRLINKYLLPDIYILKTSKGYHAYCLKLFDLKDMITIVFDSASDDQHKQAIFKKRNELAHTLRVSPKDCEIKYVWKILGSGGSEGKQSLAHALFLKNFFKVPINEGVEYDDNTKVNFVLYFQKFDSN